MIKDIKEYAANNKVPIIQDGGLVFLLEQIKKHDYKTILELGTAIGYSAINIAKLNKDITVDTIERNDIMYETAVRNVASEDLNDQINLYHMDIKEFKTTKKYDFIFIDAAKGQYYNFLNQFIDNLEEDGMVFFDNIVFHGLTKDPSSIKNRNTRQLVKKINNFRQLVQEDERFDIMVYENIGDGILILKRRKD